MKILYHHRIRSKDGQYVHVEELTKALAADGHKIIFVGPRAIEHEQFGADAGLIGWLKDRLPGFVYEFLELGYSLIDFLRLVRAIRKERPDCIYERYNLYLPSGVWVSKLFKLPMLLEVNAPLFAERQKYGGIALPGIASSIERYTWQGANILLPVTKVLATTIADAGVPPDRIHVIPNGVDPNRFREKASRQEAKRSLGLEGCFVLGFAGFVREWHRLDRVITYLAANRDSNLHLLLVGDGPARDSLQALADRLDVGDRITITGIIDRIKVGSLLAAFDVALQPSVVAYASPLKLFEYLILGHAIVAPRMDNLCEILTAGENALLFDPDSEASFFNCLDELRDDESLRNSLGQNAQETIRRRGLTWHRNAERVERLFQDLGVPTAGSIASVPGVE